MASAPTDLDLAKKVEDLNRMFAELVDEWRMMPDEGQQLHLHRYRAAQQKFHSSGMKLLTKLQPVSMPDSHPGELTTESQVKFGSQEINIQENAAAEKNDTNNTSPEAMQIDEELKSTQSTQCKPTTPKLTGASASIVTMAQLNEAVQKANQANEIVLRDFEAITYDLHGILLQDIFELPQQDVPDVNKMKKAARAIEKIIDRLTEYGFRMQPMVRRMMILHVVWSLDEHSRECWEFHMGIKEPSLQDLLNFMHLRIGRIQSGFRSNYTIPKVEQPRPKRPSRSPQPGASNQIRSRSNSVQSNGPKGAKKKANVLGGCYLCTQNHVLAECPTFRKLSKEARESEVVRLRLCKKCLNDSHATKDCPQKRLCEQCGKQHNHMLHCR